MKPARMPAFLWVLIILPRLAVLPLILSSPYKAVKSDSVMYMALGKNLIERHEFSSANVAPLSPDTVRTPAYPLFIAPFVTWLSSPIAPIACLQTLIGIFTCWMLWTWLCQIGNPRGAFIGTCVVALDAVTVMHTPFLLTESLFMLVFTWTCIQTWKSLEDANASPFWTGLLWGITTMIRPVTFYWPVFLSLFYIKRRSYAALFLAGSYLLPGLWIWRNARVANFPGLTSLEGVVLLYYPAADVQSILTHKSVNEVTTDLVAQVHEMTPGHHVPFVEYSEACGKIAWRIMRQHPFVTALVCLHGVVRILGGSGLDMAIDLVHSVPVTMTPQTSMVSGFGTLSELRQFPGFIPYEILYLAMLGLIYVLFPWGMYRLWKSNRAPQMLFILGTFLYILAISSHQGYYRFRIPLMPLLAVGVTAAL